MSNSLSVKRELRININTSSNEYPSVGNGYEWIRVKESITNNR